MNRQDAKNAKRDLEWVLQQGEEERIRKLIPRVRDPKVREIAESLLSMKADSIPIIGPLIDVLKMRSDRTWADRVIAAWSLGRARLTPDQRDAAASTVVWSLTQVDMYSRPIPLPMPWGLPVIRDLLGFVTACIMVGLFWIPDMIQVLRSPYSLIGLSVLSFLFIRSAVTSERKLDFYSEAMETLGRIRSPNAVPAVAQFAMEFESVPFGHFKDVCNRARASLRKLLHLLAESQVGEATAETHRALVRLLRDKDPVLVCDVLRAIEAVGDSAAIPAVEAVLRKRPSEEINEAAQSALRALEVRRQEQDAYELLLRPAEGDSDSLLRPAAGAVDSGAPLLRPVDSIELKQSGGTQA